MIGKNLTFIIMTILVGFLISRQASARIRVEAAAGPKAISVVAAEVAESIKGNKNLREDLSNLQQQKTTLIDSSSTKVASDESITKEVNQLKIITGQTVVTGPGVEIKFDKTLQLTQLVDLVNALRNIGAEAISVNDTRIIALTPLTNQMGVAPLTIRAVGVKEVLSDSLLRRGGIIEQIGGSSHIDSKDNLELPRVK